MLTIRLTTADRLSMGLIAELEEFDIPILTKKDSYVEIAERDPARLFECRSFHELLFTDTVGIAPSPNAIALHGSRLLETVFEKYSGLRPPYTYRINITGSTRRVSELMHDIVQQINSNTLINSPSDYSAILTVAIGPNGKADLFVKLTCVPDNRFDYRVRPVAAALRPSSAAAVLRICQDSLHLNARVLDPCCGSGTLLLEREKLSICESLTGGDISHAAVDSARINAEKAASRAKFIANDFLRFDAKRPYDELITELPAGRDSDANERLYFDFLNRSTHWLRNGGTALICTGEPTMFKRLLRKLPEFSYLPMPRTVSGGYPQGLFLLRMSRD